MRWNIKCVFWAPTCLSGCPCRPIHHGSIFRRPLTGDGDEWQICAHMKGMVWSPTTTLLFPGLSTTCVVIILCNYCTDFANAPFALNHHRPMRQAAREGTTRNSRLIVLRNPRKHTIRWPYAVLMLNRCRRLWSNIGTTSGIASCLSE